MEFNEELFNKIEDFLTGSLSQEDAINFKKEIATNSTLAGLVEQQRLEKIAIEELIEEEMRDKIMNWSNEVPINKKKKGNVLYIVMGSILFLISSLYFIFPPVPRDVAKTDLAIKKTESNQLDSTNQIDTTSKTLETINPTPKPNDIIQNQPAPNSLNSKKDYGPIAMAIYSPPAFLENTKSSIQNNENFLNKAIIAFKSKNFQECKEILENEDITNNPEAEETLAHTYFNLGEFQKASVIFKQKYGSSTFNKDQPQWYWLLALMANYDQNKSIVDQIINEIESDPNHNFYKQVLKLKEELTQ